MANNKARTIQNEFCKTHDNDNARRLSSLRKRDKMASPRVNIKKKINRQAEHSAIAKDKSIKNSDLREIIPASGKVTITSIIDVKNSTTSLSKSKMKFSQSLVSQTKLENTSNKDQF